MVKIYEDAKCLQVAMELNVGEEDWNVRKEICEFLIDR
jgi:hypothetical protein